MLHNIFLPLLTNRFVHLIRQRNQNFPICSTYTAVLGDDYTNLRQQLKRRETHHKAHVTHAPRTSCDL